mmetsp:Transcript_33105/g.29999  ORF Transcript_33105/g.29999 Transcript_33105/m.29999 type:complete len:218 (+) Transcript_33105:1162-1815(+)
MVKLIQGTVISKDKKMIHKVTGATTVQSSNLNEELGQVEYVFSDKTGTLTQNYMEFRKLIANAVPYGDDRSLDNLNGFPEVTNVNFRDANFYRNLKNGEKSLIDYLFSLALCHTIITETKNGEIEYNASSPDELALANFARFSGCKFIGIDEDNNMMVEFREKQYKYKLLQVLEFNSKRKRMSVILENPEGEVILYCKGADSLIIERMDESKNPSLK